MIVVHAIAIQRHPGNSAKEVALVVESPADQNLDGKTHLVQEFYDSTGNVVWAKDLGVKV